MTNTLEISSFLKYRQDKSKQFSTNQVSVIAPQKPSCSTSLTLVNLVVHLTVSYSPTLKC